MTENADSRRGPGPPDPAGRSTDHADSGATAAQAVYHFLSDLLRFVVYREGQSAPLGSLDDVGVRKTTPYPFVASLRIRKRRRGPTFDVPWAAVAELAAERVVLRREGAPERAAADYWLRRDILDDQVIDVSGAKHGYGLLWVLPPTCLLLTLVQEMCARMGVVTGKGLSGLIRERFGLGVSFYLMGALVLTNIGNAIADFAGVAASAEIFGISRFIAVPLGAFLLWHVVIKGSYRTVERMFFGACLFYVTYIVSGFLAKPDWDAAFRASVVPRVSWDAGYLYMVVGIIGTTVAPWMQFYQQASVVEKGIPVKHYAYSRLDTILGAAVVTVVCFFIVVACAATIHVPGSSSPGIETAADAARALEPVAGSYCAGLFAIGLLAASYFGATILPISTATSVCEAMGWESGVDKKFVEAPHYYAIYSIVIAIGVLVSLLASERSLIPIMLFSQVLNGVLLPVVVACMLRITNDREIMGEHANGPIFNVLAWAGTILVSALSLGMVALTLV